MQFDIVKHMRQDQITNGLVHAITSVTAILTLLFSSLSQQCLVYFVKVYLFWTAIINGCCMKVINLLIFILCVKCLVKSKFYFCFQGNWIIKRFNMNRAGVTQVSLLTLLNLPETCFPRNEHFEENIKGCKFVFYFGQTYVGNFVFLLKTLQLLFGETYITLQIYANCIKSVANFCILIV